MTSSNIRAMSSKSATLFGYMKLDTFVPLTYWNVDICASTFGSELNESLGSEPLTMISEPSWSKIGKPS